MDKCTARVRVRDTHGDDVKATTIKRKKKKEKKKEKKKKKKTHIYYIWRCLKSKI